MIEAGRHTIVPDDVDCHVDLHLGGFCSIASGLVIVSGQHPAVDAPAAISNFPFSEHGWGDYPPSRHSGEVRVGSDVWIGQNVSIMEGVAVGHGATLAAGAMVVRDVPHYSVVAGNPAEIVKYRFEPAQVEALLRLGWWHWSDVAVRAALPHMADIETFLSVYA